MNTTEIRNILKSTIDTKYFSDVLACDQLKLIKSDQFALIVNTDTSNEDGMHWLALFKEKNSKTIEFFDSFGMPLDFYSKYINDFVEKYDYVKQSGIQIQSNFSTTCGHFCIFYLEQRCKGIELDTILKHFSTSNLTKNDRSVEMFVHQNFQSKSFSCVAQDEVTDGTLFGSLIIQCCKIIDNMLNK